MREDIDPKNLKNPQDHLIVALDVATREEATELVNSLNDYVSFFKVGYQLFLAEGMEFVRGLIKEKKRVFLDLKMDDVDETIALGVQEITKTQVDFLTIHGNGATARAAIRGRGSDHRPKILSVTLLTSLDSQDLKDLGILGLNSTMKSLDEYVEWRAKKAIEAGCDGLIAAGPSVASLRAQHEKAIIITPGVRPQGIGVDEHKRPTTPRDAIAAGADYLVVGRPIKNAHDRREMAEKIIREIEQGLSERQRPPVVSTTSAMREKSPNIFSIKSSARG